jgi:hypothetical protein
MTRSRKPSRSRSPRRVELQVEQLESRLVPAAASVSGIVEVAAPTNPTPAASPNEGGNSATLDLVVLASVGSGEDVKSIKIENVYNLSTNGGASPTAIHLDKILKLDSGAEAEIKIEGLAGYKEFGENPLAFLKFQNDPTIKLNGGSETGSVELIGTLKVTQAGQTTNYKFDDVDSLSSGGDKTAQLDARNVNSIKVDFAKHLTEIATKTEGSLQGKVPQLASTEYKLKTEGDLVSLKLDSVGSLNTDPTSGGIKSDSSLSLSGDLKYLKYGTSGTYKASDEVAAYKEKLTTAGDLKSLKIDKVRSLSIDPTSASAAGNSSLSLSGDLKYLKYHSSGIYKVGEDVTAYKEHLMVKGGLSSLTRSEIAAVEPSQGIAGDKMTLFLTGSDTTSASFDHVTYLKFNGISDVLDHKHKGSGEEISFTVNDGNLGGGNDGGGGGIT